MTDLRLPISGREPLEVLLGGRLRRRGALLFAALLMMLGLHLVMADQFDASQALVLILAGEMATLAVRDPAAPQPIPAVERAARALGLRLIGYTLLLFPLLVIALAVLLPSSLDPKSTVVVGVTGAGASMALGLGFALFQVSSKRWRRRLTPKPPTPFLVVGMEVLLLSWLGYELYSRNSAEGTLAWWRLAGAALAIAGSGIAIANPAWTAVRTQEAA